MLLNLETDYAIRIVTCLAEQGERIGAKNIAERTGVTLRFSLKILNRLVLANIVKSYKGAKGGYVLQRDPSEITLLEVIEQMCGLLEFSRCQSESCCTHPQGICRFNSTFNEVTHHMRKSFSNITFKV